MNTQEDTHDQVEDWRSIVLLGANVATYKFALGHSLLELAREDAAAITVGDLAPRFAGHVARHLQKAPVQQTGPRSRFLDACRAYNRDDATWAELVAATCRYGFRNVLDAFHTVGGDPTATHFYEHQGTRANATITLTDELFQLGRTTHAANLVEEVEARWRLVETAWEARRNDILLTVGCDAEQDIVYADPDAWRRVRKSITSCLHALNGYQKGRCFYCGTQVSVIAGDEDVADVDHFHPASLQPFYESLDLDGPWNLVLSCHVCNRGVGGKHAFLADRMFLHRLYTRNERLIASHHPLRPTLIEHTGRTPTARRGFLVAVYREAEERTRRIWSPSSVGPEFL